MVVIDASAAIELLMLTPTGLGIARRVFEERTPLGAPELIDVEVARVVRRYELLGDLGPGRARALLEDLADLELRRYPHRPLLPRIWDLRHNLTAYDASYVALAEGLDMTLWTCDRGLANAPHEARVELF